MRFGIATLAVAGALVLLTGISHADPYEDAVPMLEQAGGSGPVEAFLKFYGPAEMPKAFAVSKDGAFGGRWKSSSNMEKMRKDALKSCKKKKNYNKANPCVIFMENEKVVWTP